MAHLLYAVARWAAARRRLVLSAWLLLLIVIGGLGGALHGTLSSVFSVPGIESQNAQDLLQAEFPAASGGTARIVFAAPPGSTLADDVARLRQVLDRQDGPAIVAGHSYGGQIMTALGTDAPNVAGLVYIAAFGLDEGESIGGLLAQGGPPTPALAHLDIDKQGYAWLPEDDFVHHFAADVARSRPGSCTPCSSPWPPPPSRT